MLPMRGAYNYDASLPYFTGKERDVESNLDNFDARYYSSGMGRFTSADWSESPEPVPYATLTNPQTLNLYSYVKNNPLRDTDPTGNSGNSGTDGTFSDILF
jgi:RHS repeat-associated protein